ncbi:hypothetical protein AQS8620_03111 [Aquimixticola soesokkakensis]|uniref:Twin-arginine translocation pathway signal n=1 Tax=Aquimixticola soesokkakensis TaxID=1519096 RepID=A0A1Y5TS27_9RHOB|nr:DUF1513 domain-containing protein [Aquimixticola soesokkakensis]SLN66882.1 hypothetical protein AQS8620_03111 [Aquimixticola soesokkakensis]
MQTTRRAFLASAAAASLLPRTGWAAAGDPAYLAAAATGEGFRLYGLDEGGIEIFSLPLPDRGHAAAAHPQVAEAVAFARRPGTFAIVLDCRDGAQIAELASPEGRHFYGHGAFTADGRYLLTTENDFEKGEGRIGVWDRAEGYARIDDLPSGGIGPHEILRLRDGGFAVANGALDTHPDSDRVILNLATMQPNLTYLDAKGAIGEQVMLPAAIHSNSIRHLAQAPDGQVGFAMQWQEDMLTAPALLGLHRRGDAARFVAAPDALHRKMQGYAGSIAFSGDGTRVAISSPKGSRVQVFDATSGAFLLEREIADVCGLAALESDFITTDGTGKLCRLDTAVRVLADHPTEAWDNHIVPLLRI